MLDKPSTLDELVTRKAATRLRAFCREATKALPNRVAKVMLFGSRARGNADIDSDDDVAVFVENYEDRRATDHLLADIAYEHILSGIHISPVSVPSNFLQDATSSTFAQSLIKDGLVIS